MIEIWERKALPNGWTVTSEEDPRQDGLVRLANLLCDVSESADGFLEGEPVPTPREIAAALRDAADQIDLFTAPDEAGAT